MTKNTTIFVLKERLLFFAHQNRPLYHTQANTEHVYSHPMQQNSLKGHIYRCKKNIQSRLDRNIFSDKYVNLQIFHTGHRDSMDNRHQGQWDSKHNSIVLKNSVQVI